MRGSPKNHLLSHGMQKITEKSLRGGVRNFYFGWGDCKVFQIGVRGGEEAKCGGRGIRNFAEEFYGWWEPEQEWFWRFKPFSMLKTGFCEYWISIKIKISMICVSKEYEMKTKMLHQQWLELKINFLLGSNLKIFT